MLENNGIKFELKKYECSRYVYEVENAQYSTENLMEQMKKDMQNDICELIKQNNLIHFKTRFDKNGKKIITAKLYAGQIIKGGKEI